MDVLDSYIFHYIKDKQHSVYAPFCGHYYTVKDVNKKIIC